MVWNWLDGPDIETREQSEYHDLDDELLEYIDWLSPKKREDLRAIAIEKRGTEQARRRGVEPATASGNGWLSAISPHRESRRGIPNCEARDAVFETGRGPAQTNFDLSVCK